jgi:hypothetical protein
MMREGARPEIVRDNMGHANIDVTQNVTARAGGKTCYGRREIYLSGKRANQGLEQRHEGSLFS